VVYNSLRERHALRAKTVNAACTSPNRTLRPIRFYIFNPLSPTWPAWSAVCEGADAKINIISEKT
jgi:hypothetical protein